MMLRSHMVDQVCANSIRLNSQVTGVTVEIRHLCCQFCDRAVFESILDSLLPKALLALTQQELLQTLESHLIHILRRRRAKVRDDVNSEMVQYSSCRAQVV